MDNGRYDTLLSPAPSVVTVVVLFRKPERPIMCVILTVYFLYVGGILIAFPPLTFFRAGMFSRKWRLSGRAYGLKHRATFFGINGGLPVQTTGLSSPIEDIQLVFGLRGHDRDNVLSRSVTATNQLAELQTHQFYLLRSVIAGGPFDHSSGRSSDHSKLLDDRWRPL